MGKKYKLKTGNLSFKEAQEKNSLLKQIVEFIDFSLKNFTLSGTEDNKEWIHFISEVRKAYKKDGFEKDDSTSKSKKEKSAAKMELEFLEEIQNPEKMVLRNVSNDREYNLDSVIINDFAREHNKDIDKAIIHIGPYADEYARSLKAMALTIGNQIYFRNGAYKPETEEGRKLIAHELTHVTQNKEKPLADNRTKIELENEAEKEEIKEQRETEQFVTYTIGNKKYKIKKQNADKINNYTQQYIEDWVQKQESQLSPDEYLKLLFKYKKYLESSN